MATSKSTRSATIQSITPRPDSILTADMLEKLAITDQHALKTLMECGIGYFNPLIGETPDETFSNIRDVMNLVGEVLDPKYDVDLYSVQHGLKRLSDMVYFTADYAAKRASAEGGAA